MAVVRRYSLQRLWACDRAGAEYFPFVLQERRSEILFTLGEWTRAEAVYDECRQRAGIFGLDDKRAHYEGALGWLYFNTGRDETAREMIEGAISYFNAAGNKKELGKSLNYLGSLHWRRGEYDKAIQMFQRDLDISTEIGDQDGINSTTGNLGIVYNDMGDLDRAMEYYRRQERLSIEQGNRVSLGTVIGNMADVYLTRGDYQQAEHCGRQQLQIFRELGEKQGVGIASNNIGSILLLRGNYDGARDCFLLQLEISREIGDRMLESIAVGDLGQVAIATSGWEQAEPLFERALAIQRELGLRYYLCFYLAQKAIQLFRAGDIGQSKEAATEARAIASDIGRHEVVFETDLLAARMMAVTDRTLATIKMRAMLADDREPHQIAAIHYELYRLNAFIENKHEAEKRYRELYVKTPNILYKQRLLALVQ